MRGLIGRYGVDDALLFYALLAGNDYASTARCGSATALHVLGGVQGGILSAESILDVIRGVAGEGKKRKERDWSWQGPSVEVVKLALETGLFMFKHQLILILRCGHEQE